jgi:hypothetical protein
MEQRGVSLEEIQRTLNEGRAATDARSGTYGKVLVFPYASEWEGSFYQEIRK